MALGDVERLYGAACCLVGWKWPVACTDTVVAPGDGERVFVVMVRDVAALSSVGLCCAVLFGEYEATEAACEVAAFCRLGCCARKAARKPPKKGLLVVMLVLPPSRARQNGGCGCWSLYDESSRVFPGILYQVAV